MTSHSATLPLRHSATFRGPFGPHSIASLWEKLRREAFAVRPRLSVSEWARRYRRIVMGDAPGPWKDDRTPYLREIQDAFADPGVRVISIIKGSQVGGTEAIYNMLGWMVDERPGACMLVYPDKDSAADQVQQRLIPTIRASPRWASHLSGRSHDTKARSIRFDTMSLFIRGAHSEHKLESIPARVVIVDELDRCRPDTPSLVRERVKTYAESKIVYNGKPGDAGRGIDEQYQLSDRRQYHVPCPFCREYHVRRWAYVRWQGMQAGGPDERQHDGQVGPASRDVTVDPAIAEISACMQCPRCTRLIGAEHNLWQLSLGVWVPACQRIGPVTVDDDAAPRPGVLIGAPPPGDHKGYHIPTMLSGLRANPYGEAARAFVERRGRMDRTFVTDKLGEAWQERGEAVDVAPLRSRAVAVTDGGYRAGSVPRGVLALAAGIDVQATGKAYVEIRGLGAYGEERWLIHHECLELPVNKRWSALEELLFARPWPTQDGRAFGIHAAFIDSGDRTIEVYDWVRSVRARGLGRHLYPVKGVGRSESGKGSMNTPFAWSRLEKYPDGKPMPGGLQLLRVNVDDWRTDVQRRLRASAMAGGGAGAGASWGGRRDGGFEEAFAAPWWLPEDVTDDYLLQLTAEHKVPVRSEKRSGSAVVWRWRLRPGRTDNHYFDAAVYLEAGAAALGIRRLTTPVGVLAIAKPVETEAGKNKSAIPVGDREMEPKKEISRPSMLARAKGRPSLLRP